MPLRGLPVRYNRRRLPYCLYEAVPDFRVCGHPSDLQSSLCTLHLIRSGLTLLLSKCNTRYGWLARPYPMGTFTPQETPSFAWRTNASAERRAIARPLQRLVRP
jgi:hypothetical protein